MKIDIKSPFSPIECINFKIKNKRNWAKTLSVYIRSIKQFNNTHTQINASFSLFLTVLLIFNN